MFTRDTRSQIPILSFARRRWYEPRNRRIDQRALRRRRRILPRCHCGTSRASGRATVGENGRERERWTRTAGRRCGRRRRLRHQATRRRGRGGHGRSRGTHRGDPELDGHRRLRHQGDGRSRRLGHRDHRGRPRLRAGRDRLERRGGKPQHPGDQRGDRRPGQFHRGDREHGRRRRRAGDAGQRRGRQPPRPPRNRPPRSPR